MTAFDTLIRCIPTTAGELDVALASQVANQAREAGRLNSEAGTGTSSFVEHAAFPLLCGYAYSCRRASCWAPWTCP